FTNDVQKIHPAVANLDDDPDLEIVVPSGCSEIAVYDHRRAEPEWRTYLEGSLLSSPVIGDVDGNGVLDIVIALAAQNGSKTGGICVLNAQGQPWPGWPVLEDRSFVTSPALGDLDADGRLEIVVPSFDPPSFHVLQWD